ncbi:GH3 auxin-responsive promoter family protein [Bacteroides sp. OttesenSCG-928-D19]|nr:GH3 auxin-responsive promoter family protein [Bacteroides sp. OttesenSCG-928-D19]
MDILTKLVSPVFSARQRKIEQFGRQTADIQTRQLKHLLKFARDTEWGRKYGFRDTADYKTFCERVPVSDYEDLHPFIERMVNGEKDVLWPSVVHWFAQSSGTTNARSKYIPVTQEVLKKCHYKGGFDTVALYLRNNPQTRFFSKKGLILGGSHSPSALNTQAHCGDLSAVLLQNLNPLVNLVRVPPKEIILMDEWEAKIKAIVENTWNKDVVSLSGIPSWMLVLIKSILKKTGKKTLNEVWPNLEVFFHGGVGFEPYRTQYKALIPSEKMHYMETYNASEGFFGIQDDPADRSMLLMLDYGTFYEFIPMNELVNSENPKAIPLEEVKTGENYAMVISTTGGLWRYRIGDTIRFTSLFPHKFIITGRTKFFINAFGEELMVDNAEKGIRKASEETDATVKAYTAAPQFLLDKGKGRHQWIIEFEKPPASPEHFAGCLDKALQELNSDYSAKRYKEISLLLPEIIPARENLFFDWMKKHNKLGGQHKVPGLSNNRDIINELIEMNVSRSE